MRRGLWSLALAGSIAASSPGAVHAQWIVDLAGAWGDKERTIDAGVGYGIGWFSLVGGVAAVEHGLQAPHEWRDDKTRVFNGTVQVDPRAARTVPFTRGWARLELKPSWWGGAVMWDPRNHPAIGAFGEVKLALNSYMVGEVRWVHTLGHLLAFRLRFR